MAGSPSRAFPRGGVLSRVSVLETASVSRSLPRMCDHVDAHVLTHTRAHMQTCVPTQTRTAAHRHASHTRTHAHPSFSEVHSSSVWLFLSHGQGLRHTRVRAHTRTQIRNPEVSVFLVRAHGPGHPDLCYQPRRNTGHPPRVGFLEGSLTALLEASERSCYKPWGLSGCSLTSRPAGLLVRAACADPPPYPLLPTPLGLSLQRLQSPHFVSLPLFCPSPNSGMSPWGQNSASWDETVWSVDTGALSGDGESRRLAHGALQGPRRFAGQEAVPLGLLPGADGIRLPPDLICPWPLVPRAPCPGGHRATAVRSQPSSCCRLVLTFASDEK